MNYLIFILVLLFRLNVSSENLDEKIEKFLLNNPEIILQSLENYEKKKIAEKKKFNNQLHDLENNWAVVAEAIQTILRREAYPAPYEALKGLTRTNKSVTQSNISDFIDTLEISDALKAELKLITPQNYTGI